MSKLNNNNKENPLKRKACFADIRDYKGWIKEIEGGTLGTQKEQQQFFRYLIDRVEAMEIQIKHQASVLQNIEDYLDTTSREDSMEDSPDLEI